MVCSGWSFRACQDPWPKRFWPSQGGCHWWYHWRSSQGHVWPLPQHPHQANGGWIPCLRPVLRRPWWHSLQMALSQRESQDKGRSFIPPSNDLEPLSWSQHFFYFLTVINMVFAWIFVVLFSKRYACKMEVMFFGTAVSKQYAIKKEVVFFETVV